MSCCSQFAMCLSYFNKLKGTFLPANYLKLDTSNGPLTGPLDITTNNATPFLVRNGTIKYLEQTSTRFNIYGGSNTFKITAAPLIHDPGTGNVNYSDEFGVPGVSIMSYVINDRATTDIVECRVIGQPWLISTATGTENWGVACLDVAAGGGGFLTMYFKNSDFVDGADIAAWLDALAGGPGVTCDYYRESIWTFNGAAANYTWANPDSKVIVSGFTTPPTFQVFAGISAYFDNPTGNFYANNDVVVYGDLLNVYSGKLLFGAAAVPFIADYLIQAFKSISLVTGTGNLAAFILGFQTSGTQNYNDQIWGFNCGFSLYNASTLAAACYSIQNTCRADNGDNVYNAVYLNSTRFTMAGGSWPSTKTNIGSLAMFHASFSREGGDAASTTTNLYILLDDATQQFDWDVTNFYGVYILDHSLYVSGNCYGVYNLGKCYFQKDIEFSTGAANYLYFRSTANYIQSSATGILNICADYNLAIDTAINVAVEPVTNADKTITTTTKKHVFLFSTGNTNRTLNLQASATEGSGRTYRIKKTDSGTGNVIVQASGAELIDGSNTHTIIGQYTAIDIVCDGTGWHIF